MIDDAMTQSATVLDERTWKEAWDSWYATLPADLRKKLSLHDFKRLGECFSKAFSVTKTRVPG